MRFNELLRRSPLVVDFAMGLLLNVGKTQWMIAARMSIPGVDDPVKAPVELNVMRRQQYY